MNTLGLLKAYNDLRPNAVKSLLIAMCDKENIFTVLDPSMNRLFTLQSIVFVLHGSRPTEQLSIELMEHGLGITVQSAEEGC